MGMEQPSANARNGFISREATPLPLASAATPIELRYMWGPGAWRSCSASRVEKMVRAFEEEVKLESSRKSMYAASLGLDIQSLPWRSTTHIAPLATASRRRTPPRTRSPSAGIFGRTREASSSAYARHEEDASREDRRRTPGS